jgi:predicted transposase YdaD
MCEATKRWEQRWTRKITDGFINMMGVRKEGEENLAPEEAIERLESKGRIEGEKKGIAKEKMEIAQKMKKEGCSKELIEKVTGILL